MSDPDQEAAEPRNIDEVLLALQRMNITVKKTAEGAVRGTKVDKYADLPAVNAQVLTALNKMGTIWKCRPHLLPDTPQGPGRFVLRYSLKHVASGTADEGDYPLGVGEPQKIGSAITYARRYALLAVTGVVAEEDDDDGQGGATPAARKPRKTAASRATATEEPPLPSEADDGGVKSWTPPMMRKWMAQNREAGITGDAVKDVAADMLGRKVTSSNEITHAEMRGMIDAFEKALKDPDTAAATVIDIYRRTTGPDQAPPSAQRSPAERTRAAVTGAPAASDADAPRGEY